MRGHDDRLRYVRRHRRWKWKAATIPGRMADPIRLTKGVHTRDIRSSLTPGRTNRVFAALDGPPLRVLEKYPLDVLELGHGLPVGGTVDTSPQNAGLRYGRQFPASTLDRRLLPALFSLLPTRRSPRRRPSSGTWYTRSGICSWTRSRGR